MRHTGGMEVLETFAPVGTFITSNVVSSWDVISGFLIVIVPALVLFYIGWYIGRGPFVAILLALYAAYAVYIVFPYTGILPSAPPITALAARLVLYLGLVVLFYIILRRVVVSDFLYIGILGLGLLSLLGAAFLVALAYHVFTVTEVYQFNPALNMVFAAKQYFFWWFLAPAVGLLFLAK